jgi:outer membrane protein TolC
MRQYLYFVGIFMMCFFSQISWADVSLKPEILSLSQAMSVAFEQNPQMVQARQAVEAAQGGRISASRLDNPELTIESDTVSIKQRFDPLGVKHLKGKAARNQVTIQEQHLKSVWSDVYVQVRENYSAVILGQTNLQLQKSNLKGMRQFFSHVQMRHQSGKIPKNQLQRAKIELLKTESEYLKIDNDLNTAKARLNLLLGRSRETPFDIQETLKAEDLELSLQELTQKAIAQSPWIAQEKLELDSAGLQLKQEQLSRLPSFALGLSQTNQKDDDDIDNNVAAMVEVSIPLWTLFNQGGVKKAQAERKAQESKMQAALKEMDFEVYRLYQEARLQMKLLDLSKQALGEANEMFVLSGIRYQEGDIGFMEYMDQAKTAIGTRRQHYESLYALNNTISLLEKTAYTSLRKEEYLK